MEPTDSEFWTDLLIRVVYVSSAFFTMYLITGPPLERLLQRIRPAVIVMNFIGGRTGWCLCGPS